MIRINKIRGPKGSLRLRELAFRQDATEVFSHTDTAVILTAHGKDGQYEVILSWDEVHALADTYKKREKSKQLAKEVS